MFRQKGLETERMGGAPPEEVHRYKSFLTPLLHCVNGYNTQPIFCACLLQKFAVIFLASQICE